MRKRWEIELRAKKARECGKRDLCLALRFLRAPFDRAGSTGNRPNPINNDRDMAELPKVN